MIDQHVADEIRGIFPHVEIIDDGEVLSNG